MSVVVLDVYLRHVCVESVLDNIYDGVFLSDFLVLVDDVWLLSKLLIAVLIA